MAGKCQNCGTVIDGFNGEMVMLTDSLWKKLTKGNLDKVLCSTCITNKLERPINKKDLKYKHNGERIPVNVDFAILNNINSY